MLFEFTRPDYLYILFLIPVLILLHFILLRTEKSRAVKFANFEAMARIKGVEIYSKNIVVLGVAIGIVFFLSLALAGLTVNTQIQTSKMSFVIAIDSSRSMEAQDFTPTRLDAAKKIATDFINSGKLGTKTGVISFSGNTLIEKEVTSDKEALATAIDNIQISDIGGTDIAEAVVTATNMLNKESHGAIVILSDGQINVGGIETAVDYAKKNNIVIYTIAIGTAQGGQTAFGISTVDEDSLKALSYNTGGEFFSAENNEDLQNSLDLIAVSEIGNVSIELSKYLIIVSIILFLVEFVLINSRFRQIP